MSKELQEAIRLLEEARPDLKEREELQARFQTAERRKQAILERSGKIAEYHRVEADTYR